MNNKQHQDYVTVIGNSYIFPISDLLKKLIEFPTKGVNEVQTSVKENGYAVSVIALMIHYIESKTVRIKFESNDFSNRSALKFLKKFIKEDSLYEQVKELFVIRDCIAHNHLWRAKFKLNEEQDEMKLLEAELDEHFGDNKFNQVIDFEERKTKILKLNLFTTRINYKDVQKVVEVLREFITYLNNNDFRHLNSLQKVVDRNGTRFDSLLKQVSAT